MRRTVWIGSLFLSLASSTVSAEATDRLEELGWMAGSWAATDGDARREEHWTSAAGGIMLGVHRDVGPGGTAFEFLRIEETPRGVVYLASPQGRPATAFALVESAGESAVFANPEHDFPQRILYWRDGDGLCAAVEGAMDGETVREEWCWKPSVLRSAP